MSSWKYPSEKMLLPYARALLAGKNVFGGNRLSSRWTLQHEAQIRALAEKVRKRQEKRGRTHWKRTYARYCRKSDHKGTCRYCWPHSGAVKYAGRGWYSRRRLKNWNRQVSYFDIPDQADILECPGVSDEYDYCLKPGCVLCGIIKVKAA